MHDYENTKKSWNRATSNHNTHKGNQADFFKAGGSTLFPDELELLGDINGLELVHLQCNSGQDTLSLAKLGAKVTGVDFSDVAIEFAKNLSEESGITARFIESEVVKWLENVDEKFDIAFASYGATCWLPNLGDWAKGVYKILKPGGRLVYLEFHPILWSISPDFCLKGDSYFHKGPYKEAVGDYVAESGTALLGKENEKALANNIEATSWEHTIADMLQALIDTGFNLEKFKEYPYSNGCMILPDLVEIEGRRFTWPEGVAQVPLMYGFSAIKK